MIYLLYVQCYMNYIPSHKFVISSHEKRRVKRGKRNENVEEAQNIINMLMYNMHIYVLCKK